MKAIVKYRRNSHERYWIFFGSWYDIQYHLEQLFKTDIEKLEIVIEKEAEKR